MRASFVGVVCIFALAGCRLVDVVDHEPRVFICAQASSGSPCVVNGDVIDRGAGVETSDGACAGGACVSMRGSELAKLERNAGTIRLAIDIAVSIASALLIFFVARRLTRRRFIAAVLVVACVPAAAILTRYPKRMIASARTPRMPNATFAENNAHHPSEVVSRDGKDFLVTNVSGSDALGAIDFLVAYDLASGSPTILSGPSRDYDHELPALFVRAHDKLAVVDTDNVVRIFEVGSFRETGRVTLPTPARGIQRAPGDAPMIWAGENKFFGYVDVDHAAIVTPHDYWANGIGYWKRDAEFCPGATPLVSGTHDGRSAAFTNGCVQTGLRGDDVVVERRDLAAPYAIVWTFTHVGEPGDRRVTIAGDNLYEIERESNAPMLVQRSLGNGARLWSVSLAGTLAIEAPFVAGKWLVVPIFPMKGAYRARYEIRDAATGALARTLP